MTVLRFLHVCLIPALCWLAVGLCRAAEPLASLEEVRAEPNLEKRSRQALAYSHAALDRAVKAYADGEVDQGVKLLDEIQQAVELSQESLKATGKAPSKRPKHFKHAEIETRKLIREMENAERQLNFDQRDHLHAIYDRVEKINRELLMGIMTKPKK